MSFLQEAVKGKKFQQKVLGLVIYVQFDLWVLFWQTQQIVRSEVYLEISRLNSVKLTPTSGQKQKNHLLSTGNASK